VLGFHTASLVVPAVIESFGSTSLVEVGNVFYLDSISSGTGPQLKYGGAAVTAGQFGGWTPIGAEQTSSGYDVAWKMTGADQYTVWSTGSSGNYLSNLVPVGSGSSTALEALETTFHQDLNSDGVIGLPPLPTTTIESFGSTSLVEVGNVFYLDSISSGTGPQLKYGGAAVTAGQFGGWTPIGAEQTSSFYDAALNITGADQYTVWSTDSSGNYLSNLVPVGSGSSTALEAMETTFHQDLNSDGVIGVPALTAFAGANSGPTAFYGAELTVDTPSTFNGQIIGFTGGGTLAGSDQIDLRGLNYKSLHSSFDASTGSLSVGDGSATAMIRFQGHYSQDNFQFTDDGN